MVICCCDGTVDGILSAVYKAWTINPADTRVSIGHEGNMEWFAEYVDVDTRPDLAARVARTVVDRISQYAYEMVYKACVSPAKDRGEAVFQFIRCGIRYGERVTENFHDKNTARVFELSRNTNFELCHYRGFLRFRQQGDYLLAKIEPKNDILSMLADHFSDRLMQENFAIIDMNRGSGAIHKGNSVNGKEVQTGYDKGISYYITDVDPDVIMKLRYSDEEEEIRELWETFEKNIAIEPRRNIRLQQQNMPLRFRSYMDIRK